MLKMDFFHSLVNMDNIIRLQGIYTRWYEDFEDWQRPLVESETPPDEPEYLTATIHSYYRLETQASKRHWYHV